MKTIGILGGMSWVSSLHYYKWLNELAQEQLGPVNESKILLNSLDWAKVKSFQAADDWNGASAYLSSEAQKLEQMGAGLILIGTNTMHKVAKDIEAATSIPLIHIADATADAISAAGLNSIALLGTSFTMEQEFYKKRIEDRGITVIVPEQEDRDRVNSIIFDELCQNIITEPSKAEYIRICNDMLARGAQGIILGCTEITCLIGQDDFTAPIFDTTRIHVEAAFKAALEDN